MVEHRLAPSTRPGATSSGRRARRGYADRLTDPLPSFRDVWRLMRERPPARLLLAGAREIPVDGERRLPALVPGTTTVTWVGHASFVLRVGGLTVLTDPVWSRRIPGVAARLTPPGVAWHALPPIDAVVISHNHYDHLDAATMRRLPRHTPVLVPAGLARWFRLRRFSNVTECDWWESARVGAVQFDFVPAHHWSRRSLTDTCRSLWGGWVLTAGAPATAAGTPPADAQAGSTSPDPGPTGAAATAPSRIYFAGDTGYGHWFTEIGSRFPGIDLALLPVGAYQPRWFMRPMHLDPEEAVRVCGEVGAARMVPMHWGAFVLSHEPVTEPPRRAAAAWAAAGRRREDLWDLAVGETRGW